MLFKDMTCDRNFPLSVYIARQVRDGLEDRGFKKRRSLPLPPRLLPIVDEHVGYYDHAKGVMEVNLTRFLNGDFKVAVTFYRGSQVSESYLCYGWDDLWQAVDPDDTEE